MHTLLERRGSSRFLVEFLHVLEMPTLLEPRGSSRFLVEFMLFNPYFSLLLSVLSTLICLFYCYRCIVCPSLKYASNYTVTILKHF